MLNEFIYSSVLFVCWTLSCCVRVISCWLFVFNLLPTSCAFIYLSVCLFMCLLIASPIVYHSLPFNVVLYAFCVFLLFLCFQFALFTGKYIYFEVTGPPYSSHAALVSPEYLKSGNACRMQFAYHFYGSNIGDMDVYFVTNRDGKIHNLWSTRGNQGNVWHMRSVLIGPQTDFNIYFNGTHYRGILGDMALDDISFFDCDPSKSVYYY